MLRAGSDTKAFRIDWYYREALTDMAALSAEEIGVLIQVINLICSKEGPIDYNAKWIGSFCNLSRTVCGRIIESLVDKGCLQLGLDKKLSQKRCMVELENMRERRRIAQKNGKKGAEIRWSNQENQQFNASPAIANGIARTSTNNKIKTNLYDGEELSLSKLASSSLKRFS